MMLSRFFPLGQRLVCILLSCLLTCSSSGEVKKTGKPKPQAKAPAIAYLRIWKGAFPTGSLLHVLVREGKKASRELIAPIESRPTLTDYLEVPAQKAQLDFATGSTKEVNQSLELKLAQGERATLIINEVGSALKLELLPPATSPGSAETGELVVRNLTPDLRSLVVKIGESTQIQLGSFESLVHLRGLPREDFHIETSGEVGQGKTFNWSNQVSLRANRKATLLIYPDPYGRIRPRLFLDEENSAAAETDAPAEPKE